MQLWDSLRSFILRLPYPLIQALLPFKCQHEAQRREKRYGPPEMNGEYDAQSCQITSKCADPIQMNPNTAAGIDNTTAARHVHMRILATMRFRKSACRDVNVRALGLLLCAYGLERHQPAQKLKLSHSKVVPASKIRLQPATFSKRTIQNKP
jgi:hypothetical protein